MNSNRSKPLPDLKAWSRKTGIPESTLRARLARHGDLQRAIHEPKISYQEAGRMGAAKSPWRFGAH